MENFEERILNLESENRELRKELGKLRAVGHVGILVNDIAANYSYNPSLVLACQVELESQGNFSYDSLDRNNPELLARLKAEAPVVFKKLADAYINENHWILTGKKPTTYDEND